jgi:hypothetical protein
MGRVEIVSGLIVMAGGAQCFIRQPKRLGV